MDKIDEFRNIDVETAHGNMRVMVAGSRTKDDFDIVLVHGLIVSSSFMEPTGKLLAGNHRVFVPDLLGHGKSDTPEKPLSVKKYAKELAFVLKQLKVRRPLIVGGSYGCHVAVELSHLMDVKGLVFVGPTPGGEVHEGIAALTKDAFFEPPQLVFNVLAEVVRIGPARVIELLKDMRSYPFHQRLRKIKAPTMVITGEHDPFFDPSFMDDTAKSLHSSQSLCIPDVAHGLPFSQPELISDFVEQFIERLAEEHDKPGEAPKRVA
ncbi:MAG TPA: alpha/beta hydrolase [Planktothrix sp.]|jgi:pimeloyl-ACP methyl ester carboxylesterase